MQSILADLEQDLRRMMLPNTAMNLKVANSTCIYAAFIMSSSNEHDVLCVIMRGDSQQRAG